MVQTVIERLAKESSNVKGWTVALAAGTVAIMRIQNLPPWAIIAALPLLIVMALLDMYYLGVERIYRQFYAHLIQPDPAQRAPAWSMTPEALREKKVCGAIREGARLVPAAFYAALFIAAFALVVIAAVASSGGDTQNGPPTSTQTPSGTPTQTNR